MLREIDYCLSLIQLQDYSDDDLKQLYTCAGMDQAELYRAACTYWMCRMEIDRRERDSEPENARVKCIHNIFDDEHEIIFRGGNYYWMYVIGAAILIYDSKWVPYVFSIIEEDTRCVWKYFTTWIDGNKYQRFQI